VGRVKPPAARAAIAIATAQAYQETADAPTTLLAYAPPPELCGAR
jgi:hypothetical protein